jgi:hypothetical protein
MSGSAKKRAVRLAWASEAKAGRAASWLQRFGDIDAGYSEFALYQGLRAKYRIGERLRPCPGCPKCGPGRLVRFVSLPRCVVVFLAGDDLYASAGPSSAWLAERTADGFKKHSIPSLAAFSRNDRVRIIDSGAHCDGSGVLPARRPK